MPLDRQPVELDNILFDIYRQVVVVNPPVDVKLVAVDQVTVMGDADRLKQLFINLVENAIKYTPAGGSVQLSLSKDDRWARFEVCDTGIGIPPENLPHIFDRFYRVDKARARVHGGSGLGLSIAKWIATAHGGAIRVKSQPGEGTTFTVMLPVYEPTPTPTVVEIEQPERTLPSLRGLGTNFRRGA